MTMSEVRANLAAVLDRVEAGEDVVVTRHGRLAAIIARPERVRSPRGDHLFAAADELRERIEMLREQPLGRGGGLSRESADDLVKEVRASREAR